MDSGSPSKKVFITNRLYWETIRGMIWQTRVLSRFSERMKT